MTDIICSYIKDNQNQPLQNYFLMERNVSFAQFQEFLYSSSIIDPSYDIYHDNQLIQSEETFKNLLISSSQNTLEFFFKNQNQINESPGIDEENIKNVEESRPDADLGQIIKEIGQKIGMKVEQMPERPRELIQSIPFPHRCVIRQFIKAIRQNPSELEPVIQQAANFYSVDAQMLQEEVQEIIKFYKERRNQRQQCKKEASKEENKEEIKQKPLLGNNIEKILSQLKVDHSNVKCVEDLEKVMEQLPLPISRLVSNKLKCIAERPMKLKWICKRLAQWFSVNEDELQEELKNLVDEYVAHNAKKGKEQEKKEGEEIKKVFHPAKCDGCKKRIKGIRYWCLNCRNYDLCSDCEGKNELEKFHNDQHVFAKIKDTKTPYRAFPGGAEGGIRNRIDCHWHAKARAWQKGLATNPIDVRLNALEENVRVLQVKLNEISK